MNNLVLKIYNITYMKNNKIHILKIPNHCIINLTYNFLCKEYEILIEIQFDGASSGNPGLSGAGIVVKTNGEVKEYSIPLGVLSNHEAEFLALLKALEICQQQFPQNILAIQSDSQLVVEAIEKNFVKNPQFRDLLMKINELKQSFPLFFIKWIPSNQNKHADRLARQAIYNQKKLKCLS